MSRSHLSVVFAGSGGSGAMTAGTLFLRSAALCGYYGMMTQLFGPQVRGGESAALVQIATAPVVCQPDRFDLFVALDWEKLDQFAPEIPLDANSTIVCDPQGGAPTPGIAKSKARVVSLSMSDSKASQLERALRGKRTNVFAAAAIATMAGLKAETLREALTALLGDKGADVMQSNVAALEAGIAAPPQFAEFRLDAAVPAARQLFTGNEAVAVGVLRGGVRFVGCYPITPATDLVEWLAPHLQQLGGQLVLAEDELAAINMVLGASFGGKPAMTVTSGPGLSLMVEALGLGVAAEVPAVVVDVMRGGPSTGIPSKTEQSDVNIAIYGGHGDAPRVVVAPLSVQDCALTAEWAVYLAESLQSPVLLLSDQLLGQAQTVVDPGSRRPAPLVRRTNGVAPKDFKRYALGPDPITPMPPPGVPGLEWVGEGLTHNEVGIPVSGAAAHRAQIEKRAKKFAQFDPGEWWGEVYGEGDTAIVTFGSSTGPAIEAAQRLTALGRPTRVVSLRVLSPVPHKALERALQGARRVVVIEQNHMGQLYRHLLGEKALPLAAESIARPGPLPFRPGEIAAHLA